MFAILLEWREKMKDPSLKMANKYRPIWITRTFYFTKINDPWTHKSTRYSTRIEYTQQNWTWKPNHEKKYFLQCEPVFWLVLLSFAVLPFHWSKRNKFIRFFPLFFSFFSRLEFISYLVAVENCTNFWKIFQLYKLEWR